MLIWVTRCATKLFFSVFYSSYTALLYKFEQVCVIIFFSLFIFGCQPSPDGYDANGNPVYLKEYKGKWIIVNYWAYWCGYCLKEMDILNELQNQYSDKLVILAAHFNELSNQELQMFAKEKNIQFSLLRNFSLEKWSIKHLDILPLSLVFSPDQKLIKVLKGVQTLSDYRNIMNL